MWGVAILVGLYSPIKGLELETLGLLDRQESALAAIGWAGVPPAELERRLPRLIAIRQDEAARWNRGLAFVAAVCLSMGVLATMNTSLSLLKDRVRELAVRKVCGATNRDLFGQVLVEGTSTSVVGGAIGVAAGLAVAGLGADLIRIPYAVSPGLIALGLVVAVLSGLLASLWPAVRAARLQPVVALRSL